MARSGFVFLLSRFLAAASTFDRGRTASAAGMPRRSLGVFARRGDYLSPSISHATKDALVSAPLRAAPRSETICFGERRQWREIRAAPADPQRSATAVNGRGPARLSRLRPLDTFDNLRRTRQTKNGGISRDCEAAIIASCESRPHSARVLDRSRAIAPSSRTDALFITPADRDLHSTCVTET